MMLLDMTYSKNKKVVIPLSRTYPFIAALDCGDKVEFYSRGEFLADELKSHCNLEFIESLRHAVDDVSAVDKL